MLSAGADDLSGSLQFVYPFYIGTSMASPHVAGVVALMKSVNASLTPDDIDQMLAQGDLTDDLGTPGLDDLFGHGLINAQKAVAAAQNAGGMPPADNPMLGVSPASLNFGTGATLIEITLRNVRSGSLQVNGFTIPPAAAGWLSVAPVMIDAAGLGTYAIVVDRTALADGIYATTLTAQSAINDVQIPVIMQVSSLPLGSNAGYVYVLLVDALTGDPVGQCDPGGGAGQCEAAVSGGEYTFRFTDVPSGDYDLFAGSDADNNFLTCDSGGSCGAFPATSDPAPLTVVDQDRTGVDFSISFGALASLP